MKKIVFVALLSLSLAACGTKNQSENQIENKDSLAVNIIKPEEYKTSNQEGMEKIAAFVKDCEYYMLATVEGDQPRVRPFGTINVFEGKLYIQTGHKKRVAQQIKENGKVEICAYNPEKHSWIRISGKLVEDERVEAKHDMLEHYPDLRRMYDENDGNTAVYFFTEGVAWISSFSAEDEEIRF
ncbi:MAG: pyridoxamine 5'-phosphate oxidase family protein [Bacteroidales bacterium]|nr:pyridoxamine 5'-phosphate oxidase family protein [Bacteroidales bacterium]